MKELACRGAVLEARARSVAEAGRGSGAAGALEPRARAGSGQPGARGLDRSGAEGGAEVEQPRAGLRASPTARPEPGSAASGPASSPASPACDAAVRGEIAGGGPGVAREGLIRGERGALIGGEARYLLTSSSFSRINFSVSARGSMGRGISVALRRESLLGVGVKEGDSGGAGVVRVATPRSGSRRRVLSSRLGREAKWVGKDFGEKSGWRRRVVGVPSGALEAPGSALRLTCGWLDREPPAGPGSAGSGPGSPRRADRVSPPSGPACASAPASVAGSGNRSEVGSPLGDRPCASGSFWSSPTLWVLPQL